MSRDQSSFKWALRDTTTLPVSVPLPCIAPASRALPLRVASHTTGSRSNRAPDLFQITLVPRYLPQQSPPSDLVMMNISAQCCRSFWTRPELEQVRTLPAGAP